MEYLPLFIAYMSVCLGFAILYSLGDQPFMTTGFIGKLRQHAWRTVELMIPKSLWRIGASIITSLFFKRNRTFQMLYLFMNLSSHVVLVVDILPYLYVFHPTQNHTLAPLILFIIGTILYIVCCISDPGEINHKNYAQYVDMYKYDGVLYQEDNACQTCDFIKPARSKHCSTCDICIFKFDHHCVWTNRCVGGRNQRYFLIFMVALCMMVGNGVYMACWVLHNITVYQNLWSAKYVDHNGVARDMTLVLLVQHLFMQFPRIVFLATGMGAIAALLIGFTIYHFYLAVFNQTTNERYKRFYLASRKGSVDSVNVYDRGLTNNLLEVLSPMQHVSKQEKKNNNVIHEPKIKKR
ncbi:palmitoyltransferase ZDHHC4-like [Lineus longissimus]|uniref:palmitoyltransferase ZDHHC4-like n=1 Tax=Lineus longissimus TaxID=88925 RepID=UPI002B4E260D